MTNKVKPFFIRITDDMTPQMVQDAFDKCVDAGAGAYESIEMTQRKHDYQSDYSINFNYFGAAGNETFLADTEVDFGIDAQEITLDQLDEWLGLKSKVDKPNSGQDIYIAQINTLAGVESQRYFIHQYWCNSGHQNQLFELGILFTDKEKAISKTKSLLAIDNQPATKCKEWDGKGLPPIGAECEFKKYYQGDSEFVKCFIVGETKDKEWLIVHDYADDGLHFTNKRTGSFEFRPTETPEQKAERERLEAAYDLYLTRLSVGEDYLPYTYDEFLNEKGTRLGFLSIVDKTNYRKQ